MQVVLHVTYEEPKLLEGQKLAPFRAEESVVQGCNVLKDVGLGVMVRGFGVILFADD